LNGLNAAAIRHDTRQPPQPSYNPKMCSFRVILRITVVAHLDHTIGKSPSKDGRIVPFFARRAFEAWPNRHVSDNQMQKSARQ
jgi:hypothetical protein